MKLQFVICVALAAPACADHELQKLVRVRDQVCACKTVKCAETALATVPKDKVDSNPKSQRVAREMLDCLAERYETDRPSLDPDADLALPNLTDP